jgi:hypothetical protein
MYPTLCLTTREAIQSAIDAYRAENGAVPTQVVKLEYKLDIEEHDAEQVASAADAVAFRDGTRTPYALSHLYFVLSEATVELTRVAARGGRSRW